jgi:hypothetical protein
VAFRGRRGRASGALALALVLLCPRHAGAQWALGVDTASLEGSAGTAMHGRFGYRTGPPRAFIVHTVIFQFEGLGGYELLPVGPHGLEAGRLGVGLRIGTPAGRFLNWLIDIPFRGWSDLAIAEVIGRLEPFGFAHAGTADVQGGWGYAGDLGLAVDFRASDVSLGLQWSREYFHVPIDQTSFNGFGLHVEVRWF